ncbi:MAG: oligoribonuclease [Planctomycetes bacterium]|nr:oligoribonuclease [Planctomycetota bacterium]
MEELKLVWIDLEMTGLDPDVDSILEIAVIVTGPDLQPVGEVEAVIATSDEQLEKMSDFVRDMHTENGLLERVKAAKLTVAQAEHKALALIKQHCPQGEGVLAGNTIYQDRRFLTKYMPQLEGWLHYRQVDVSSLKILTRAWYPDTPKFEKPGKDHTALADIRDSIAELQHYREQFFK